MPLSGFAELDDPISPAIRVRGFHHTSGPTEWAPNAHADLEVAWVLEGEARYGIAKLELVVGAGSVIVVPPRVEHSTRVLPGTRAGSCWLSPELVAEVGAALGLRPSGEPRLLDDGARAIAIGELLRIEVGALQAGRCVVVDSLVRALLVAVLRDGTARNGALADPRLDAALSVIEERHTEPIGVDDLAQAAGLSRFHFSRLFRQATGQSPYRYLQRVRIDRARELLDTGGLGVTQVALSVGFRDLARFSRAFREQFGHSPGQLVRNKIAI
jgi:AraC family transcriptional regulator